MALYEYLTCFVSEHLLNTTFICVHLRTHGYTYLMGAKIVSIPVKQEVKYPTLLDFPMIFSCETGERGPSYKLS